MPQYFVNYPKTLYKFNINGQVVETNLTNTSIRLNISPITKEKAGSVYPYAWTDNDRPDTFADMYYGTQELFWLGMYSGDRYDVFNDFPKSEDVFKEYLFRKYRSSAVGVPDTIDGVVTWCQQTVAEYRDPDGDVVDLETYLTLVDGGGRAVISIYDKEDEMNEGLRQINVISDAFAEQARRVLTDELAQLVADLKG